MNLDEVGKLIEVFRSEAANKFLAEGWILLSITPMKKGGGVYILGFPRDSSWK